MGHSAGYKQRLLAGVPVLEVTTSFKTAVFTNSIKETLTNSTNYFHCGI